MDVCAKTLLATEKLINDNILPKYIKNRYANWDNVLGKYIHNKKTNLEELHQIVIDQNINPKPRSGQQELLENILNKYL